MAVREAPEKLYNNLITPYIASKVRSKIREFLERDHLVHIPRDEFRRLIEKHQDISFVPLYFRSDTAYVDTDGDYRREDFGGIAELSTIEYHEALETEAILQELGVTDREKEIIRLRLENQTMEEIAKQLDMTAPNVYYCLERIQKKWRYCKCVL